MNGLGKEKGKRKRKKEKWKRTKIKKVKKKEKRKSEKAKKKSGNQGIKGEKSGIKMTRKRLKDVAAIWRSAQGRRKERTATEGLKDISGEKGRQERTVSHSRYKRTFREYFFAR